MAAFSAKERQLGRGIVGVAKLLGKVEGSSGRGLRLTKTVPLLGETQYKASIPDFAVADLGRTPLDIRTLSRLRPREKLPKSVCLLFFARRWPNVVSPDNGKETEKWK